MSHTFRTLQIYVVTNAKYVIIMTSASVYSLMYAQTRENTIHWISQRWGLGMNRKFHIAFS